MIDRNAELVAALLTAVRPYVPSIERRPLDHVGAILADVVLQTGLNHASVVAPRIDRILRIYPEAATIRGLFALSIPTSSFLDWTHPEKICRFDTLTGRLRAAGINSTDDLRTWLAQTGSLEALSELRGVGPKTVDYLRMMAGEPAIPIDRHLRRFLAVAGVHHTEYSVLRASFITGCQLAGVEPAAFESGLWHALAGRVDVTTTSRPQPVRAR
jgi:hypothetical protein